MKLSEFNYGQLNIFFCAMGILIARDYIIIGTVTILLGFAIVLLHSKREMP
jgi:hypothetical protein